MGLGSTAKKIQTLSESAEAMYKQVQQLQQRIVNLEGEVDDTHDTVKRLDHQVTEQRALLLAIAEEQGLDADAILADAAIDDADEPETAPDPDDPEASEDASTDEREESEDATAD
ncbi:DUF5798 family protein [Natrarchaeobaculum aegyptiacum]|uniref:Uncharacterized protein n=1 Tax=Natrarchaeobaculum aegyptiacum TaxID=745377 RepID=A0A2Z2HZ94_9EURY|nr:DUF5798 family protein [Natrarchaeobaculum aegyptiacum]ARS91267.1 hypothetical protein B1756_17085 [Natrarchaeobaculum aegyptiacum]